jgi:hypothetical protein
LDAGLTSSYPGSGNTWTDLSGRGNSPVFTSPVWVSSGTSSYFTNTLSNSNSAIMPGNANGIPLGTNPWTVSVWTMITGSYSAQQMGIMGWDTYSSMKSDFSGGNIIEIRGGNNDRPPVTGITQNTWMNITFTNNFTGNTKIAYLNGVQKNTSTFMTLSTTNGPLAVLRSPEGNAFAGRLAIVRIWNTVLTPAEVLAEYNAYRTRYGLT